MKFSIRHLIALMIVVALGIQVYQARRDSRELMVLEYALSREATTNRELEKRVAVQYRQQSRIRKSVMETYHGPLDSSAVQRRFEALKARGNGGSRGQ